jgi:NAD(P)-dependent dehydrogenase (short-subunit alcohol dehydrogenase family)
MSQTPSYALRKGLIAAITGAGSGVGEVVARELASHGIRIALVGRTAAKLERVQQIIHEARGAAEVFPCDVADPDAVAALKQVVVARFGDPQILFNGAGLHCEHVPIGETTPHKWIETFQVNTIGSYLTCRAFMGGMIQQGWGRLLNVSSAASLVPPANIAAVYQLSKVALNHFTRQLAKELDGTGVTANVLHPGEVKTEMWAVIKGDASRRTGAGRDMLGWARMVEETGGDPPEKTAELILRLLTPAGDTINGQFLWITDGIKKPLVSW